MNRLFTMLFPLIIIFLVSQLHAQQAEWVSGDNVKNQTGVYGTMGVADGANAPGSRQYMYGWRDSNGNLYVFGGFGYAESGIGYLNDLWKWDGSEWTWVNGSKSTNQNSVYGSKGIANSANVPSGRQKGTYWIDASNNLWLFGGLAKDATGTSQGDYNDLWKWDGTNWTWVSGDNVKNQNGVYGTQGVPASDNKPGSRQNAVSWVDNSGNFWLFGGFGNAESGYGYLNDLWKFDGTDWTWISGSKSTNQNTVFGIQGVNDPANTPGGRQLSVGWVDANNNLWLFGGTSRDVNGDIGYMNDLWKWDGSNWTWISGDDTRWQNGVYGIKAVADGANKPGSRENAISWTDEAGNFWLFGGFGYPDSGPAGYLNDLWKWDGSDWTWIAGSNSSNQNSVYGSQGVASVSNFPGGRQSSIGWIDDSNNIWLFGGQSKEASGTGVGDFNDLWKISDAALPVELVSFEGYNTEEGVELNWETSTEVNNYGFEVQRTSVGTTHELSLQWEKIGFVEGSGNSNSPKQYTFTDEKTSEVLGNLGGLDGKLQYRLKQIDFDGKFEYSDVVEVEVNNLPTEFVLEQNYPNPFNPTTSIEYLVPSSEYVSLKVYDILGNQVATLVNEQKPAGNYEARLNASNLASGLYFYKIQAGSFSQVRKMMLIK